MMSQFNGRVKRLELVTSVPQSAEQAQRSLHRGRTLIVFRYPEETEHEALERWGIDPGEWGKIVWRQWREGEEIYAPMWIPGPHESQAWTEGLTRAHAELEARRKQH